VAPCSDDVHRCRRAGRSAPRPPGSCPVSEQARCLRGHRPPFDDSPWFHGRLSFHGQLSSLGQLSSRGRRRRPCAPSRPFRGLARPLRGRPCPRSCQCPPCVPSRRFHGHGPVRPLRGHQESAGYRWSHGQSPFGCQRCPWRRSLPGSPALGRRSCRGPPALGRWSRGLSWSLRRPRTPRRAGYGRRSLGHPWHPPTRTDAAARLPPRAGPHLPGGRPADRAEARLPAGELRAVPDLFARSRAHRARRAPEGAHRSTSCLQDTERNQKRRLWRQRFWLVSRRRPTLPPSFPGSTIGAGGLNFRVRNGTGCIPSAMTTETA
jgi:hypothetical protein